MNLSRSLLQERAQQVELARLNFRAGERSRVAIAYESAQRYFSIGQELLGEQGWQDEYELSLDIALSSMAVLSLLQRQEETDSAIEYLLSHVQNDRDRGKAYRNIIVAVNNRRDRESARS